MILANSSFSRGLQTVCLGIGIVSFIIVLSSAATADSAGESALSTATQMLQDGEFTEAARVIDDAIETAQTDGGGDVALMAQLLLRAAEAQASLGKDRRSYGYFKKTIQLLRHPDAIYDADILVDAFSSRWRAPTSWRFQTKRAKQLVEIFELGTVILDDRDLRLANMATKIGVRLAQKGKDQDAIEYLDQAYNILINATNVDPDAIGEQLLELGAAYARVEQMETADRLIGITMAIGATTDGPYPIRRVAPQYPSKCLQYAVTGEVKLTFVVGTTGRVAEPTVTDVTSRLGRGKDVVTNRLCGMNLARAAQEAVAKFRYIPKFQNGVPVQTEGNSTLVSFDLE